MTRSQIFIAAHKLASKKTDNARISYRLALSISLKEIYAKLKKEENKKIYDLDAIVAAFTSEKGVNAYHENGIVYGNFRGKTSERFQWAEGIFTKNTVGEWIERLVVNF